MDTLDPSAPYWLDCPPGYLQLSDLERFTICNGCGAAGAKFDFVPDTIYGLRITEACFIHDYAYHIGRTAEDKVAADLQFLNNLMTIINTKSHWSLKALRRWRAMTYYTAVCDKGHAAFWEGKKRA